MKLGEAIYKAQADAEGGETEQSPADADGGPDEEILDADFEDLDDDKRA